MFMIKRLFPICLSVIILIGFSSLSYAECAWVLWEKTTSMHFSEENTIKWELIGANEKKFQCDKSLIAFWRRMIKVEKETWSFADVSAPTAGLIIIDFKDKDGHSIHIIKELLCLPDTVDPRKK